MGQGAEQYVQAVIKHGETVGDLGIGLSIVHGDLIGRCEEKPKAAIKLSSQR